MLNSKIYLIVYLSICLHGLFVLVMAEESAEIVSYAESCEFNRGSAGPTCNKTMVCLRDTCRCQYGDKHQFFDDDLGICRSRLDGPCDLSGSDQQCLDNAECAIQNRTGLPECRCRQGFVESSDRKLQCVADFGEKCGPEFKHTCDESVPLFCRNRICDCENEMLIFNSVDRRCLGRVGAFCSVNIECYGSEKCNKVPSKEDWRHGRCECPEYYLLTSNHTCKFDATQTNIENW